LKAAAEPAAAVDKAEKWTERKIDPNAILQARLAPDMFIFTRQIQVMTDLARARQAVWPDWIRRATRTTKSLPDLKARLGDHRAPGEPRSEAL
jgi:hypothetical protein